MILEACHYYFIVSPRYTTHCARIRNHCRTIIAIVLESAMIDLHCRFRSLGSRKWRKNYSPSNEDTYHYWVRPQIGSDKYDTTVGSGCDLAVIYYCQLMA
jgi:hypothetical protein